MTTPKPAPTSAPTDDEGIGGDEPFCEHGNLLWSETCEECIAACWRLTDEITAAVEGKTK